MPANNVSIPFFLSDALRSYSEDFRLLSDRNPYLISLNGVQYSIHASEIHDSGEGRVNDDEWRIQLQSSIKITQIERFRHGIICLYIGFFPEGRVFSAWEPDRVRSLSPNGTGSVYIPLSFSESAIARGGAWRTVDATNLRRKSVELSLPIEMLGLYIENHAVFSSLTSERNLLELVADTLGFVSSDLGGQYQVEVEDGDERKRVVSTRTSYVRDPKFRDDVMEAYNGSCCICNKQIGLVQAAHIVPHSVPESTDHVTNGLALCIEHHKLYDDGLLLPSVQRSLYLNLDRVEHLKNIGQANGLDELESLAERQYEVPENARSRPNEEYLYRGLHIRLGTDA